MAVTYGFMRQGLQVREYSKKISRHMRLEHNILGIITKDIQSAQWIDNAPIPIISFKPDSTHATSSRLELLGYSRLYDGETKTSTYLNKITYAIDLMDDGINYALYRRKQYTDTQSNRDSGWEYLYGPLVNVSVTAWDAKTKEWVETFSSAKKRALPSLIQVVIEFPPEDETSEGLIISRKIALYDQLTFIKASAGEESENSGSKNFRNKEDITH